MLVLNSEDQQRLTTQDTTGHHFDTFALSEVTMTVPSKQHKISPYPFGRCEVSQICKPHNFEGLEFGVEQWVAVCSQKMLLSLLKISTTGISVPTMIG